VQLLAQTVAVEQPSLQVVGGVVLTPSFAGIVPTVAVFEEVAPLCPEAL
jgi:hypothetical protein